MKVLYISYDGMTDPLGQSQVIPYLIELSKRGFEIHLLSTEKPELYDKNQNIIQDILDSAGIKWHKIFYTKKPPVISTLKDVLELNRIALTLHNKYNFSFTHCRSYIASLIGLNLHNKRKVPFVFDMRGFWADERVDGKIWNINRFPFKQVYSFFKQKEKEYISKAKHVISLTYNGKKEIEQWGLSLNNPITVIPCCADLEHFDYSKVEVNNTQQLKSDLGIKENDFVLTYLGSIGTWYLLDEMLDFFKLLNAKQSAKFLFITKDDPESILSKVKEKGIASDDVIIKPSERKDLPQLLSVTSASIFFIMPTYSKKASSPTKQAELLGMGIPIICNSNVGDTNEILEKEGVGFVIDELNESAYRDVINTIDKVTQIPKEHLRSVAKKYFSLESGTEKYLKVWSSFKED